VSGNHTRITYHCWLGSEDCIKTRKCAIAKEGSVNLLSVDLSSEPDESKCKDKEEGVCLQWCCSIVWVSRILEMRLINFLEAAVRLILEWQLTY
jgi:hypothetical protein